MPPGLCWLFLDQRHTAQHRQACGNLAGIIILPGCLQGGLQGVPRLLMLAEMHLNYTKGQCAIGNIKTAADLAQKRQGASQELA
jgi:hypothetical protein